jgi:tetratricopeptide (TPR) repeat protein
MFQSFMPLEVGNAVLVIRDSNITLDSNEVDHVVVGQDVYVEAIKNDCLLVKYKKAGWREREKIGWLARENVVPSTDAMPYLNDAIRKTPTAVAHNARGWLLEGEGEFDNAISDYDEALRLDAQAFFYNNRGNAWSCKGESEKALADYDEALRLESGDATIFTNRGNEWLKKGNYDQAIADFSEAIRLDSRRWYTYQCRAGVWKLTGEYANAIADYHEVIRLNPKPRMIAYDDLARLWATCPDKDCRDGLKAVEYAKRICEESRWDDPLSLDLLAAAYAEFGNFSEAVRWQQTAIDMLTAESAKANYRTRLALYQQGKPYREVPQPPIP